MTYSVRFYTFAIPISALAGWGYASSFKIMDHVPKLNLFSSRWPVFSKSIENTEQEQSQEQSQDIENILNRYFFEETTTRPTRPYHLYRK